MRLLLDTHLLLWSVAASRRLPIAVRDLLLDREHTVLYSAASVWEIAIKSSLARDDFRVDVPHLLRALVDTGFVELPITSQHAAQVAALPDLHMDPFDRMLIAQAFTEPAVLLTNDGQLGAYGPQIRVF